MLGTGYSGRTSLPLDFSSINPYHVTIPRGNIGIAESSLTVQKFVEKHFPRDIKSLQPITEFTDGFLARNGINKSHSFPLHFVIEELFTNMVKYNPRNGSDISVRLEVVDESLVLRIVDFDSEPFDVTKSPPVNIHLPLEKRRIGGLGIHLIKKMVDSIEYEYVDRESRITVTRKLGKHHV